MKLPRRYFLHLASGAVVSPAVAHIAEAQSYPSRPVQIIVGYAAGGPTDILARLATRLPWLPDVPALGDFLPGYEVTGWIGVAAPKNTPVAIIDKLNKAINAGLADPKIAARVDDLASTVFVASPAELDKLVVESTERWGKVIRATGIKAE